MSESLRADVTRVYWLARAYYVDGKVDLAQQKFQSIADQTNFYGQLALEELGQKTIVVSSTHTFSPREMVPVTNNQVGCRRALRFFDMNLRFEGIRE